MGSSLEEVSNTLYSTLTSNSLRVIGGGACAPGAGPWPARACLSVGREGPETMEEFERVFEGAPASE